jgi:predicted membrane-bound mannosyltransferase
MRARDRRFTLGLLLTAVFAWAVVGFVVTTVDPRGDATAGYIGAGALGVASTATAAPLLWLLAFARQRRIAYRGDWLRAARRAGWIGLLVAVFVVMRINGVFQPEIGVFLAALALVAEVTLSR